MDEPQLQKVKSIMAAFRLALRNMDVSGHSGLRTFPHGSCRWASFMLAKVLEDYGEDGWNIRCGEQGPLWLHSHCWLERGGYILDITADQVAGYDAPLLHRAPSPFESVLHHVRSIPISDLYDHRPILDAYGELSQAMAGFHDADAP
jgi:hypothetical protein